jgi:hypothetical protein
MAGRSPTTGWQGPLRAAGAVFVLGFLVVWLIKPIGNPCPDLGRLPQGSTASSSPSFGPPGTRTCTYQAAGGIEATARYVPWLDWALLLLLAGIAAAGVALASPATAEERAPRPERPEREPRAAREKRAPREPRAPRAPRTPPAGGERDAAERERARRERAERNR